MLVSSKMATGISPLLILLRELNLQVVINKLQEVIAARGRKSTNRKHHVRSLQELFRIADEVSSYS